MRKTYFITAVFLALFAPACALNWVSHPLPMPTSFLVAAAVTADLNGDGAVDVVVGGSVGGARWLKNLGNGTFQAPAMQFGDDAASEVRAVGVTDLTLDGRPDVVVAYQGGAGLCWFKNLGGGAFQTGSNNLDDHDYDSVTLVDFDADGLIDVLAASRALTQLNFFRNGGGTTFEPPFTITYGDFIDVAAVDVNNDGCLDVVHSELYSGEPRYGYRIRNCVTNTYYPGILLDLSLQPISLVTADFDRDGRTDFAINGVATGMVAVYYNRGVNGSVAFTCKNITVGGTVSSTGTYDGLAAGDLDGDGWTDLLYGANYANLTLVRNLNGTAFQIERISPDQMYASVAVGDLDGDGGLDALGFQSSTVGKWFGVPRCRGVEPLALPLGATVGNCTAAPVGSMNCRLGCDVGYVMTGSTAGSCASATTGWTGQTVVCEDTYCRGNLSLIEPYATPGSCVEGIAVGASCTPGCIPGASASDIVNGTCVLNGPRAVFMDASIHCALDSSAGSPPPPPPPARASTQSVTTDVTSTGATQGTASSGGADSLIPPPGAGGSGGTVGIIAGVVAVVLVIVAVVIVVLVVRRRNKQQYAAQKDSSAQEKSSAGEKTVPAFASTTSSASMSVAPSGTGHERTQATALGSPTILHSGNDATIRGTYQDGAYTGDPTTTIPPPPSSRPGATVSTLQFTRSDASKFSFSIDTGAVKMVPYDDLENFTKLGSGGFGTVYKVQQKSTYTEMALKVFPAVSSPHEVDQFVREATVLLNLHHPHCLACLGVVIHENELGILTELMDGGDLSEALAANKLSRADKLRALRDLAKGLAYLHGSGITHADLKPSNVLLDARGRAVLADFGLAGMTKALGYTERYAAPEVLLGGVPDIRSDIYSFALVILVVLNGGTPFPSLASSATRASVDVHMQPMPLGDGYPEALRGVVAQCVAREPSSRPLVSEVTKALIQAN